MSYGYAYSYAARRGGGGAPPAPTTLEQLIAAVNAGDGSVQDWRLATNPGTYTSADLSANGRNFTQATGANQPGISPTLGATCDGMDSVDMAIAGETVSIIMAIRMTAGQTDNAIVADQAGNIMIRAHTSALTFSGATVRVNGVSMADRTALLGALNNGANNLLEIFGLAMTSDTALRLFGRPTSGFVGSSLKTVVLFESAMGAALADTRALGATWVME